ncbi:FMN-dependent NADH-azoreductase [Sphingobacterium kitahiroshimense]|uniref:FMN dependent NADH:quinone oxidoreductase n=1 Tax=Sphingobacterium kitahiroshimense TaxID=470446 RepID=A0ABV0BWD6_9SPHI
MKKILVLNTSPKKEDSLSRQLTQLFISEWLSKRPDDIVCYRDIVETGIPHLSELWISAALKPIELRSPEERDELILSDILVQEIETADIIVLGTPMYNWSIPSALKAYIDHIVRVGRTIALDENNIENPVTGLLRDKQIYLCLVRGGVGYQKGERFATMDFQRSYLKTIFNVMGIDKVAEMIINGTSHGQHYIDIGLKEAIEKIKNIVLQHVDTSERK